MKAGMKYSGSTQSYVGTPRGSAKSEGAKQGTVLAGFSRGFVDGAPFGGSLEDKPTKKKRKSKS